MSEFQHDLPAGIFEWVEKTGGGTISQLRRHVARREAWIVDVKRPDGSVLEGFLRLQRAMKGDPDVGRLKREVRIMESLGKLDIPAPDVYGWNEKLNAALLERDAGSADIDKLTNKQQQRAVMEDFIRVVARIHKFEPGELDIDDVMQYMPKTPQEAALNEVDLVASQWNFFLKKYVDPLTTYGLDWLHRFAPTEVSRISLVQGDTGPVNFMFLGGKVSSMIDWECGHYGDPLEDLGNIMVREFYNPSGGLTGLFKLYEEESGVKYDRFRAQYYAVQQNVRGMIPIHFMCSTVPKQESFAWYLCYKYLSDRGTIEMLAQAMGVPLEKPALPEESKSDDLLARSAISIQDTDVKPRIDDKFGAVRANDVNILIQCMDRRRRYGAELEADELNDFRELLGKKSRSLGGAHKDFIKLIRNGKAGKDYDDKEVIRTLLHKGYRDQWLYSPAVDIYPAREWSAID